MNLKLKLSAMALCTAAAVLSFDALACSTIIVGKDASKTGEILVGHNEDNGGRILTAQFWVPPATHQKGEMIEYEPGKAKIPQVEKTFGFYWSQTFDPTGASFSDGFVNENGVVIVSNACTGIYDDDRQALKDGGIGYGIRRLMAERAASARDAINIAIDLLGRYGYFADGRTYTVADAKEAWQIAIHQGNTWVARRVKDNEVVYIPNNFMMDKVDATDTENVIVAPGMIERAIKNGRYTPKTPGVYNDFNYRVAVQPPERRAADYNQSRNSIAWEKILGVRITDPEKFPYSVESTKKFGVEDLKDILRSHEKEIGADPGWYHYKALGLCRPTTHESVVYQLRADPLLTAGWRTLSRPCETPYVPFYPLAKPAKDAAFLDWQTATAEHFKGKPEHFGWSADWPVWTFVHASNTFDYQRDQLKENSKFIAGLEKHWTAAQPEVERRAAELLKVSHEKAAEFLHDYNAASFFEAAAKVSAHTAKAAPHKIAILADSIDPKSTQTVDVVLYSDKTLDAAKVDLSRTYAGVGRASIGTKGLLSHLAKPVKSEVRDVDGDGLKDLVVSFEQKALSVYTLPGAVFDLYLYTFDAAKNRVSAMDAVLIETEGYKGAQKRTEGADV